MEDRFDGLLRSALVDGTDESLTALTAAGPDSVRRFHGLLTGEREIQLPRGSDRGQIENEMAVCWALATYFPDEYLGAFNEPRWARHGNVLSGLGYTGRIEAAPLLISALHNDTFSSTRCDAAGALAYIPGPDSITALTRALDDPEYLVRYHAIQSLGSIGDRSTLDRLRALASSSAESAIGIAAAKAVKSLADRLDAGVSPDDIKLWLPPRG